MDAGTGNITFDYKFVLGDGKEKHFNVTLEGHSLNLILPVEEQYPDWTKLGFFKCPNCPIEDGEDSRCPIAVSLVSLIDFFKASLSYEEADVIIETSDRKYVKHTALQEGLSSLVGIYMVTSGCPVMEKLKPMVRFHLPFATEEETKYRVMSMYLMAQFFRYKNGREPDWDMKRLVDIYEDIRLVNKNFCQRLQHIRVKDASVNALVNLDCFAMSVAFSISQDMLYETELLFNAYMK
jgi:hypothetical protein